MLREVALDLETTGLLNKKGDNLLEIGCVEIINKKITGNVFHSFINPYSKIFRNAFMIHDQKNISLINKPGFYKSAVSFFDFIKSSRLIIHNSKFDIGFINKELKKINLFLHDFYLIDTMNMSKKIIVNTRVNLNILCSKFGIPLSSRKKHNALVDAKLLSLLYLRLSQYNEEFIKHYLSFDIKNIIKKI